MSAQRFEVAVSSFICVAMLYSFAVHRVAAAAFLAIVCALNADAHLKELRA